MDLKAFKASTNKKKPPKGISLVLEALWHQAKGDWDTAHQLAQSQKNPMGFLVHAYLHRVEGDKGMVVPCYISSPRVGEILVTC